jgi:hypothetical protein
VITVDIDKDIYTRHGFHLNAHGKEQVPNKIVQSKSVTCHCVEMQTRRRFDK